MKDRYESLTATRADLVQNAVNLQQLLLKLKQSEVSSAATQLKLFMLDADPAGLSMWKINICFFSTNWRSCVHMLHLHGHFSERHAAVHFLPGSHTCRIILTINANQLSVQGPFRKSPSPSPIEGEGQRYLKLKSNVTFHRVTGSPWHVPPAVKCDAIDGGVTSPGGSSVVRECAAIRCYESGPHRTRQRCFGHRATVRKHPDPFRPVKPPSAPLEAVLTERNGPGRARTRSDSRKQGRNSADGCGEDLVLRAGPNLRQNRASTLAGRERALAQETTARNEAAFSELTHELTPEVRTEH